MQCYVYLRPHGHGRDTYLVHSGLDAALVKDHLHLPLIEIRDTNGID